MLTEESIGKLFLAGFLPGLMLTVLFMITVLIVTWFRPEAGPRAARMPMMERLRNVVRSSALIGSWLRFSAAYISACSPRLKPPPSEHS